MTPSFRFAAATVLVISGLATARAQTGLAKQSPFAPPASANAAPQTAQDTIEFAGVSSIGKKTDLIFFDRTAKKSRWVPLGETVDGISAISYDPQHERASVKINGEQRVLTMRKGGTTPGNAPGVATAPVMTPMPLPTVTPLPTTAMSAPPAPPMPTPGAVNIVPAQPAATPPPTPNTPEAQARAETEARMLVSDLLEIGMAQRKAYEEAQRKAAQNQSNAAPAAPNPN